MYLLFYLAAAAAILFVIIYATGSKKGPFNWNRYSTALVGMCLFSIVIIIILVVINYALNGGNAIIPKSWLVGTFIFTILLSVWATKHIRHK
jgi:RsiW-degrading membrane proteinase PrsW (M82 family)